MLWKAEQDKDGEWKMLSIFTKKTATGRNSCYICGQFDLGGGVLKVAYVNVWSIKLVEVASEMPEEPTETTENEAVVSPDPITHRQKYVLVMTEAPVKSILLMLIQCG